ncbi:putative cystathionine gamma-synthase [Saccoglossus kowalevskii]|uniref:cystathionine gamma-lyase n=1 Tax=Saccoglossus kowalevskii TaxID=10224 RepID=A0ABM0MA83_SACKO|nr:PREDICTED: cystathionine gamma-lyase-like [Saccoglossus kowalevskii]
MAGNPITTTTAEDDQNATSLGFDTLVQHAGQGPEHWCTQNALVPPIVTSTTFLLPGIRDKWIDLPYVYSRQGNPTRNAFEICIASLDGAKHGIAFSSGVTTALAVTMAFLKTGDHIICGSEVYGGISDQFRQITSKMGIDVSFIDTTDPKNVEKSIKTNTRMIWLETPSNPCLRITDIKAIAVIAHQHPDLFLAVDNTFSSPYYQKPLELGADLCMASVTKYINGHSDVLMGILCTNNDEFNEKLRNMQLLTGGVPSPFDCYLANRGVKTLPVRMERHQQNAFAVANFLQKNPRVEKALYPGLPNHPQYELAKKQMKGFSGMVCFWLKGGFDEAEIFLNKLQLFKNAASLGSVHSLAEHPITNKYDHLFSNQK